MKKFYEVKMLALMTVVVCAEDDNEAMELASESTGCGDYQFFECSAKKIEDKHLEASKRHADLVIED